MLVALCDELGFDYGFAVEHHFAPHESWMPAPAVDDPADFANRRALTEEALRQVKTAFAAGEGEFNFQGAGHRRPPRIGYWAPVYVDETDAADIADHLLDVEYLLRRNLVFVGSPETVARQIQAAATEGFFNVFEGEFNLGGLDEESIFRSIRLFGQHVLPVLHAFDALGAPAA